MWESVGRPGLRGRLYTYRYTVTTRMTSALRWAAMRAILMFQKEVMDKVTIRQCPQTTTFSKRKESRSARPNRLTASTDDDELMLNVLRCHLTY